MASSQSGKQSRSRRTEAARPTRELLAEGLPPQNLDAERCVLGSILRDNICMVDVVKLLQVDSFYSAKHQKIYEVMLAMFNDAKPIDGVTLAEELTRRSWLMEIGGAPAIVELLEETLTAASVMYYSKIVHDKAILRNLIHISTEILRDAYDSASPADELLSEAEKRIFAIVENKGASDAVEVRDVLSKVFDRISFRKQRDGSVGGVPSGFVDLDELTNGWQESELIILAARPSMGKTAFALNLVEAASVDYQMPCLFVSLEMSQLELAERLLCSRGEVNGHFLRRGRLGSEDMTKLINASEALSGAPLYIDDTPGQTMLRITATARRLKHRTGLKMVIIDYLQLIEADDRSVSRQEQISTISRRLKNLARELHVPVIALSQLNRAVETREGHRPRMADLRESGSIEQDADVVLLLHRDDFYESDKNVGESEVIIAKQRNGPVDTVKLTFRKEITRFADHRPEMAPFGDSSDSF